MRGAHATLSSPFALAKVYRVGFEIFDVDRLEGAFVRGAQDDPGGATRMQRFAPSCRAEAPTITRLESWKLQLWDRGHKVVASRPAVLQERTGNLSAHSVRAQVVSSCFTGAAARISGQRSVGTKL
jgi:hypothetical protein